MRHAPLCPWRTVCLGSTDRTATRYVARAREGKQKQLNKTTMNRLCMAVHTVSLAQQRHSARTNEHHDAITCLVEAFHPTMQAVWSIIRRQCKRLPINWAYPKSKKAHTGNREGGGKGGTHVMHGHSRMTLDPRIPTMSLRDVSGFHRPDRHCPKREAP